MNTNIDEATMKTSITDIQSLSRQLSKYNPIHIVRKLVNTVRFIYGCFIVIKDPFRTDVIIKSAQNLVTPERFKYSQDFLKSTPEGRLLFKNRPLIPKMVLDDLIKLPSDSFGYAYAHHMKKNNLDPDFFDVDFNNDISYSFYRYGKVHDLWHIATGFDTTIPGELAVLTFTYVQTKGPGAALIIGLAILHGAFFKPQELGSFLKAIHDGWQVGQNAVNFFTIDWSSLFNLPLKEVQIRLNIVKA